MLMHDAFRQSFLIFLFFYDKTLEVFFITQCIFVRQPDTIFLLFIRHFLFCTWWSWCPSGLLYLVSDSIILSLLTMSLSVGDLFEIYNELKDRIADFQRANYCELVHRDSWTLEGAKTRVPKVVERAKPELRYYSITLKCSLGGKKHKGESSGTRPCQRWGLYSVPSYLAIMLCVMIASFSTFKRYCPAEVKLSPYRWWPETYNNRSKPGP